MKEVEFFRVGSTRNIDYFRVLKQHGFTILPTRSEKIIEVKWQPQPPCYMKINIDGSALGSPGTAGYGGLFQNARGFLHGAFTGSLGTAYAFEAELMAAIYAINKAFEVGWRNLWTETITIYVVHMLCSKDLLVPWSLRVQW